MNRLRVMIPGIMKPLLLVIIGIVVAGCGSATQPTIPVATTTTLPMATTGNEAASDTTTTAMTLTSPVFGYGEPIPAIYSCAGRYISPELHFAHSPAATQSFVLIMTDPDAPMGTFTHWVVFDIPATTTTLAEDVVGVGIAGSNGFGKVGYGGPCPPPDHDAHRYFFYLYALDVPSLGLDSGVQRAEVEQAIAGHILAEAELMGTFDR